MPSKERPDHAFLDDNGAKSEAEKSVNLLPSGPAVNVNPLCARGLIKAPMRVSGNATAAFSRSTCQSPFAGALELGDPSPPRPLVLSYMHCNHSPTSSRLKPYE
ncbi:hypothetical protein KOW79_017125 [Hemibagrus wyckioides]|uniref:Uncharacterized protein n=1 Tax=Hemibagrus wyckioides TaxID=337641 RepID=A0A9D3NFQ3_9TELE|nr:hypothetical protein KOW79_017125 [Hemibagrus wyckioides]